MTINKTINIVLSKEEITAIHNTFSILCDLKDHLDSDDEICIINSNQYDYKDIDNAILLLGDMVHNSTRPIYVKEINRDN